MKDKQILLVRPNWGNNFQITPPLGLGYLSSSLKANGYKNISLLDCRLSGLNYVRAANITGSMHPDIIGIQVYSGSEQWVQDYVKRVRHVFKLTARIVCGGHYVSALEHEAHHYLGDVEVLYGECEDAIVEYIQTGKTQDISHIIDVNKYPIPDWRLLQPHKYFQTMQGASIPLRGKRPCTIITSRGCPYHCTFCAQSVIGQRIYRAREVKNIIQEIQLLKQVYEVDEIFFNDDNLTFDINRAKDLFQTIIDKKIKIHWRMPNGIRIEHLDNELISLMKASGGYFIGVGVESGNPTVLRNMKKSLNLDRVRVWVHKLRRAGFFVSGFFIIGFPSETEEQVKDSIRFSLEVPFDRIQVSPHMYYPGSEDYDRRTYNTTTKILDDKVLYTAASPIFSC